MVEKLWHYSFTNLPTIYDEEALTALELCARLGVKYNELVDDYRKFAADLVAANDAFKKDVVENFIKVVTERMEAQDNKIDELFQKIANDLLGVAHEVMDELIANGELSAVILDSFNKLDTRVNAKVWKFDSVAAMRNSPFLGLGDTAITQGYHTPNDGGGATYLIREATEADVEDGGSVFIIGDMVAELVHNGSVNIKQFGAKGDGVTDDTAAIVAAGKFCRIDNYHTITLTSDHANYHTTEGCYIFALNDIDMQGMFNYLELRSQPTMGHFKSVRLRDVKTLVLRDFMGSEFHVGNVQDLNIIADATFENGYDRSCFAYNLFEGGTIHRLSITGVGSGWVNENVFNKIRVIESVFIGGDYGHNNNRFYDICLEGGGITLDHANANYFTVRAEGTFNINTSENSINNIIKKTWVSYNGSYRNDPPSYKNGVLYYPEIYEGLKYFTLKSYGYQNLPWKDGLNIAGGYTQLKAWTYYDDGIIIPIEHTMVIDLKPCLARAIVAVLNEAMKPIDEQAVISSNGLTWSASENIFSLPNDVTYHYFSVHPEKAVNAKYLKIRLRSGSEWPKVNEAFIGCWAPVKPAVFDPSLNRPTAETKPTQTDGVPVGFTVYNTTAGSETYCWRFNGSAWIAVPYTAPVTTTTEEA